MAASKLSPKQVADWRKGMKLSVEQFAAFTGAAAGRTVRRWEDGTRDIPEYLDILYELSQSAPIRGWMVKRADRVWNDRLDAAQDAEATSSIEG